MKCNDTGKMIIDKLAGELSARRARTLDKHLDSCAACRKEFEVFSKVWQSGKETLEQDTFAKELTPGRRSEIFAVAANEEKRRRRSMLITRLVEYTAVVVICLILAGMLLPALSIKRRIASVSNTLGGHAPFTPTTAAIVKEKMEEAAPGGAPAPAYMQRIAQKTADREAEEPNPFADADEDSAAGRGVTRTLGYGGAEMNEDASQIAAGKAPAKKWVDMRRGGRTVMADAASRTAAEYDRLVEMEKPAEEKRSKGAWAYSIAADEKVKEAPSVSLRLPSAEPAKPNAACAPSAPAYGYAIRKERLDKADVRARRLEESAAITVHRNIAPSAGTAVVSQSPVKAAEPEIKLSYEAKMPEKTFELDLKLWNLTTSAQVIKYLSENRYPVPAEIRINWRRNIITVQAPEATLKKIEPFFRKLQEEEKELRDFSNGLPFIKCASRPVSTFSIDTDTASYVQARKCINRGERPDPLKIRPEEFINYFDYNYRSPGNATFAVYPEAAPSPFRPNNTLFRVGIQGKRLGPGAGTRTHYTILLDTSGSMAVKDRMELAQKALSMLLEKLQPADYISLLLCGNSTSPVLQTKVLNAGNRRELLTVLQGVSPRGVADFAAGISAAYSFADKNFLPNGANRVIIVSDGIFELSPEGRLRITAQIEAARKRGISNIVIGLGGDGDDETLEKVAALGDGSYVFLDSEQEAKELFSTQFEARFREIARDVKIQVEFNKDAVSSYRQIGYKNRQLSEADFRNDRVDAGEVGSGQAVTALYELKLKAKLPADAVAATIRIRYKKAEDMSVEEKTFYLYAGDIKDKFADGTANFKLAAYAAEFAEALRYPETRDIASLLGIADRLNTLWMQDYRKNRKVTELLALLKRCK